MQDYVTMHLFNVPAGADEAVVRHVDEVLVPAARALRGFKSMQLFRCSPHQLTPEARQPWRYATVYENALAAPEIDLPAKAPLFAEMRDAGLIANDDAERNYSYGMYHPWKYSDNYRLGPLTHLMFLLANLVPGHAAEYHQWYDDVHSVEVSESQGYVGMRRGGLTDVQAAPVRHCPGDQLILGGIQTDQLEPALQDFIDRAYGRSPSGVAWGPRSSAASVARTVHVFESVAGPFE